MDNENKELNDAGTAPTSEVDWEAKYNAQKDVSDKLEREKENYRIAMLQSRGYLTKKDDEKSGDVPTDIADVVEKVLKEKQVDESSRKAKEEERRLAEQVIQENKKLKEQIVSLSNRSQLGSVAPAGSASSVKDTSSTPNYWTPEQEASLRAKGIDPDFLEMRTKNPNASYKELQRLVKEKRERK